MSTYYLAGPMRGYPEYNFPAFMAAAAKLRGMGHKVMNPAERDMQEDGFDPKTDAPRSMAHYMAHDLPMVCRADGVVLLPGWEKSHGCRIETYVAKECGIPLIEFATMRPVGWDSLPMGNPPAKEVRATDPDTGGQKGQKLERLDLCPVEPLMEFSRVWGFGAKKYADNNWRKGYPWSWSFSALQRHTWAFWGREDRDSESKLHHLAHAAWHCFVLMWFSMFGKGKDDRWQSESSISTQS